VSFRLEPETHTEASLPIVRREGAGFERWNEIRYAHRSRCVPNDALPKIESQDQTSSRVVFDDSAQIEIGLGAAGPLAREEIRTSGFRYSKRVFAEMHKSWPDFYKEPKFVGPHAGFSTEQSLQMISGCRGISWQYCDVGFEIEERKCSINKPATNAAGFSSDAVVGRADSFQEGVGSEESNFVTLPILCVGDGR